MLKRSSFSQSTYEEKLLKAKNAQIRRQKVKLSTVSSQSKKDAVRGKSKAKKGTKRMIYGVRVWSLKVAHNKFSLWLRKKIPYCELCGVTEGLTVSHYIGRKEKATTFDLENCDVFCWSCHAKWEDRKQYEYRDWKINKIGQEAHDALKLKARNGLGEKDAIYNMMLLIKD